MSTAVQYAYRPGEFGADYALRGTGTPFGAAFLPDVFGAARQSVEMAFGADLDADPATWGWTDVTRFFLWDPGVEIDIGDPDEALDVVSASFAGTIRNDQPNGGDFTIGNALGRNWPNIRENTPTRARLDVGNGASDRFFGYASQWKPAWDADREFAVVRFKANGIMRRLRQGDSAAQSPMWRFNMLSHRYPIGTNEGWPYGDQQYHALPTHYWSLEESAGALRAANAVQPSYPLQAVAATEMPLFGGDADLIASKPGPQFINGAVMQVNFPLVTPGGRCESFDIDTNSAIRVQFLLHLPDSTVSTLKDSLGNLVDGVIAEILRIEVFCAALFHVTYFIDNDPTSGLIGYTNLLDSAGASLNVLGGEVGLQFERGMFVTIDLIQTTAGVEVRMGSIPLTAEPATGQIVTEVTLYNLFVVAGATLNGITGIKIGRTQNLEGASVTHLSISNGPDDTFPDRYPHAVLGRPGDRVDERLRRLSIEDNIAIDIIGDADIPMGPMGVGTFLDLVSEGRKVDGGALLDGLSAGLTYVCRTHAYSSPPTLTLDASQGDVITPLETEQDDQGRVNVFTADNPAGGQQTFTRTDGDLGTATVGVYDDSDLFSVAQDATLYDEAAWRVHQGTIGGLRYPTMQFELEKPGTSAKAQRWLDCRPLARLDILALEPGAVTPDGQFLLRAWNERWNSKLWIVVTTLTRYAGWAIGTIAADTGDTGDYVLHLDIDGATLAADVAAGGSSLTVATTSGPIWVHPAIATYADDITGLYLAIDGLRVKVTAIAGTSSPQTFTVDPATVLKALSAGASVSVWQQPVLGL